MVIVVRKDILIIDGFIIRDFTRETKLGQKIQGILGHKYGKEDEQDV